MEKLENVSSLIHTKTGRPIHYLLIITLNINGLNSQIERYRPAGWLQKDPSIFCQQKTPLTNKYTHRQSERMEKNVPCLYKAKKQE